MLNTKQKEASEKINGPLLIIAGAGSGKTTVLVYRIVEMIKKGVSPKNILAITFTNKAAQELKNRVSKQMGENVAESIWISTFHNLCLNILKNELGEKDFVVVSSNSAKQMIKEIMDAEELTQGEDEDFFRPNNLQKYISLLKNEIVDANSLNTGKILKEYVDKEKIQNLLKEEIGQHNFKRFKEIFMKYQTKLDNRKVYDYNGNVVADRSIDVDDILLLATQLFINNPTILEKYQERFKYIMIDEYQDTNRVQYVFAKLLADKYKNFGAVGK